MFDHKYTGVQIFGDAKMFARIWSCFPK